MHYSRLPVAPRVPHALSVLAVLVVVVYAWTALTSIVAVGRAAWEVSLFTVAFSLCSTSSFLWSRCIAGTLSWRGVASIVAAHTVFCGAVVVVACLGLGLSGYQVTTPWGPVHYACPADGAVGPCDFEVALSRVPDFCFSPRLVCDDFGGDAAAASPLVSVRRLSVCGQGVPGNFSRTYLCSIECAPWNVRLGSVPALAVDVVQRSQPRWLDVGGDGISLWDVFFLAPVALLGAALVSQIAWVDRSSVRGASVTVQ